MEQLIIREEVGKVKQPDKTEQSPKKWNFLADFRKFNHFNEIWILRLKKVEIRQFFKGVALPDILRFCHKEKENCEAYLKIRGK